MKLRAEPKIVQVKVAKARVGWRAETTVALVAYPGLPRKGPRFWRPGERWLRRAAKERLVWRYGIRPGEVTIEWRR